MRPSALLAGVVTLGCLGTGIGTTWAVTGGFQNFTSESWRRADVLVNPRSIPEISLQDQTGQVTPLGRLCERTLVIDFIYTRCTAVCRSQGAISSQLARRLDKQTEGVQVLSISFDPDNDTPAALSKFKHSMEPTDTRWQLARPTNAEGRQALLQAFGVVVIPDGYGGFDHNSAMHVVDHCKLVKVLDPDDIDGAIETVRAIKAVQKS